MYLVRYLYTTAVPFTTAFNNIGIHSLSVHNTCSCKLVHVYFHVYFHVHCHFHVHMPVEVFEVDLENGNPLRLY